MKFVREVVLFLLVVVPRSVVYAIFENSNRIFETVWI